MNWLECHIFQQYFFLTLLLTLLKIKNVSTIDKHLRLNIFFVCEGKMKENLSLRICVHQILEL